jgi:phage-related protein
MTSSYGEGQQISDWRAGQTYNLGQMVNSIPKMHDGAYAFLCVQAGTSGNTQPLWPATITTEVTDGGVVWKTFATVAHQLFKLEPSAIIELFEIHLTTPVNGVSDELYFHAGTNEINTSIVFNNIAYDPAPVEADGFIKATKGALPRPTLRVANLESTISSIINTPGQNILGATVKRVRTCQRFLDSINFFGQEFIYEDGTVAITENGEILVFATHDTSDPFARFPDETYIIERITEENREFVEIELASSLDVSNLFLPRRRIVDSCPWKYRDAATCGYDISRYPVGHTVDSTFDAPQTCQGGSATDVCAKTREACEARYGDRVWLPFGGFPIASISD